eukprot:g16213.t1
MHRERYVGVCLQPVAKGNDGVAFASVLAAGCCFCVLPSCRRGSSERGIDKPIIVLEQQPPQKRPDKDAKLGCGFDSTCREVTKVQPGSLADQTLVAPGFILMSINGDDSLTGDIKEKLKARPVTLQLGPKEAKEVVTEASPHSPPEPEGLHSAGVAGAFSCVRRTKHRRPSTEAPPEHGVVTLVAMEGSLGFGVSAFPPVETKIWVKKVEPEGWAAQHGVKEGFQLLKVQGQEASSMSNETWRWKRSRQLGGEAKARLRILEDPGKLLELKEPFTVGVCFRAGEHRVLGWDSVLQGDDNKHWLAFRSDENKLGLLKGDDYEELPAEFLQQGWVQVFLRSVEGGTSVLAVDAEGLLDLGLCPVSLLGSKLRACGWASNELDLAALVLWDRCLSWTELQTSLAPAVVAAPEAVHVLGSSITGQVVDLEGHPVSNVNIKWKMNACTSDLEGHFQMDDDSTDVPDTVLREVSGCSTVSFECEGFAPTTMKASESFQVVLRPLSATATMDPKEGGLVEDPKSGSSLTDALAYPDGRPATGPVTLRLSCLDVTDPKALASMPGDFTAQAADGSTVMLESLGAAWINATDEQGEELQVREGSEMILDLHTTATANAQKLGATAELWSFDEQSGQWRAEVADLELDGVPAENSEKSLAAPVKKFGYWNMDLAYSSPNKAVLLQGTVVDKNSKPMPTVQIWGTGKSYYGRSPDTTSGEGRFEALMVQFESSVDIEVQYHQPATTDQKIEVFYAGGKLPAHNPSTHRLKYVPGIYVKDKACDHKWTQPIHVTGQPPATIEWDEKRRRWSHSIFDKVLFCLPGEESPVELDLQASWWMWENRSQQEREAHLPAKTHLPTEAVNVKVPDSPPAQPSVTSAAVDEELEPLRTKLASSTDELRRAQAELTEVSQKSQASQEELTELKEQLAAKDRDLMVVNQKLLASNASNDEEAKKEIAELKRRLEEQEEELKRTKQEVEAAKASHERHIAESQTQAAPPPAAERPTEPGLAEGDFAKRVREAAEVRDLKQQLELEIKSLRGELEGLKAEAVYVSERCWHGLYPIIQRSIQN